MLGYNKLGSRQRSLEPLAALHLAKTGFSRAGSVRSSMARSFGIRCSARCLTLIVLARCRMRFRSAWGDIQLGVVSRYRDDLPSISISRLRALDVITAKTTTLSLQLGDIEQTVAIALRRFPNGGSWSLFICPTCGHRAQTLRVLDREIVCRDCGARNKLRRYLGRPRYGGPGRRPSEATATLSSAQSSASTRPKLRPFRTVADCADDLPSSNENADHSSKPRRAHGAGRALTLS